MFDKINIRCILSDHLDTLKNDNTSKAEGKDYLLFLAFPLVLPAVLLWFHVFLSESLINILITSLAIFVGLLLNVMVVIFDIIKKNDDKLKLRLIKETYSNISFAILLSIFTIIPLIGCYVKVYAIHSCSFRGVISGVCNGLSYYLLALFFVTLLMIVKRVHIILTNEMNSNRG